MRLAIVVIVVALASCHGEREVVTRVEVVRDQVRALCLTNPPPVAPAETCAGCEDDRVRVAAWSDYGRVAARWIALYAWPTCAQRDAVLP